MKLTEYLQRAKHNEFKLLKQAQEMFVHTTIMDIIMLFYLILLVTMPEHKESFLTPLMVFQGITLGKVWSNGWFLRTRWKAVAIAVLYASYIVVPILNFPISAYGVIVIISFASNWFLSDVKKSIKEQANTKEEALELLKKINKLADEESDYVASQIKKKISQIYIDLSKNIQVNVVNEIEQTLTDAIKEEETLLLKKNVLKTVKGK